jgi:acyl carrier protein
VEDIPEDTPFADLGIDSMMAIEIVADVEKSYDITISEEELAELTNLSAVYQKVKEKLSDAG